MKARELEALLVEVSGRTASDIDQRIRVLRKLGLAKAGARGLHAPDITGDLAAGMILAVTTSVRAVDAAKGLDRFHEAHMWPHTAERVWPFDYYLSTVLMRPDQAASIANVRLNLTAGSARVEMRNGEVAHFIPRGADLQTGGVDAFGGGGISDECVIAGDFLHRIALATHEATKAWHAKTRTENGSTKVA